MKTVLFATHNKRKIGEARLGCKLFNIEVKPIKLDIEEIQSSDPKDISKHKAMTAYSLVKKPIVVSDTFWNIPTQAKLSLTEHILSENHRSSPSLLHAFFQR